ncbi:LysM peptidoglycan-binding domain-containing protein [Brevibacillus fluminis]|uniref:LysM peptidoglycan-binding domain-containing protein n=1 Tax=Brevibacillus fluminis TaxID=511487 RepID=UPI003F8BF6A5
MFPLFTYDWVAAHLPVENDWLSPQATPLLPYDWVAYHHAHYAVPPHVSPFLPFLLTSPIPVVHAPQRMDRCLCPAEVALSNEFRSLWEQHVAWTRMVIISIAAGLPDEELTTKRLLRNPSDNAAVIARYYGEQNAAIFRDLFTDHLVIAARLVKAAKAGDQQAAAREEQLWYQNADAIAAFLAKLNPYWPEREMRDMLHTHLALTKAEAVARLTGDFATDIATYDKIEQQALEMADAFSAGIVKQFPQLFRC